MKKIPLLFTFLSLISFFTFGQISVSVVSNGSTITINDGANPIDIYKSKVFVCTSGDNVIIQWDEVNSRTYKYTQFTAPSGASAAAVEAAIAALLPVPTSTTISSFYIPLAGTNYTNWVTGQLNLSANKWIAFAFTKGIDSSGMYFNGGVYGEGSTMNLKSISSNVGNALININSGYHISSHKQSPQIGITVSGHIGYSNQILVDTAKINIKSTDGSNTYSSSITPVNGFSGFSQNAYGTNTTLSVTPTSFEVDNHNFQVTPTYGMFYSDTGSTIISRLGVNGSVVTTFDTTGLLVTASGYTNTAVRLNVPIVTINNDAVLTATTTQSVYHKGIGITNTVTTLDGSGGFTIKNATDNSKSLNFQIAATPSNTAVTVSTRSVSGTMAYLTDIPATLSYTPENVANKATDLSSNDNTHYPTTAAVQTAVNNAIAGVNPAVAVLAATTTSLQAGYTYTNGVGGIGATITFTNTALIYDSYTLTTIGQRILVKNEGSAQYNGVYFVSVVGTGTLVPTIFTRALDFDQASDINNTGAIPVINGTLNGTTSWVVTSSVTTVGTDAVTFSEFSYNPTTLVTVAGTQTLTNKSISYSQITGSPSLTLTTTGTSTLATASGFSLNIPPIQAPLVQGTGISISSPTVSLSANALVWNESFIIDGLGIVIGTGTVICKYITQSIHITGYAILEISSPPIATTTTVNFTSNAYTTYPPTSTITPTPILTAAKIAQNLSITPVAIPAGNTIMIIITGNDLARKLQVVLIGTVD